MTEVEDQANPFAAQRARLRQAQQARADELNRQRHLEQDRQAAIDEFVRDHPVPAVLGVVERDEWVSTVADIAVRLFPPDLVRFPDPSTIDLRGIDDPSGATFLACRVERIAAIRKGMAAAIEQQRKAIKDNTYWRTPPARYGELTIPPEPRYKVAEDFTEEELASLSTKELQERLDGVLDSTGYIDLEVRQLKLTGPNGLGSERGPIPPGQSGSAQPVSRKWGPQVRRASTTLPVRTQSDDPQAIVTAPDKAATRKKSAVPKRGTKHWRRWVATWLRVRPMADQNKPDKDISKWVNQVHPELGCSPETVAKIISAGTKGFLD